MVINMRYLLIFLLLFSFNTQAQSVNPVCSHVGTTSLTQNRFLQTQANTCLAATSDTNQKFFEQLGPGAKVGNYDTTYFRCNFQCQCPQGTTYHAGTDINGNMSAGCIPDQPSTSTPEEESCTEDQKVFDPSTGNMVCPASGDGSSSASSQTCVVPGDFNGDCVPDEQPTSSPSDSSSPPVTSSPSSSGGDDGGDDGGGGGGGGGNPPSNNTGGGSASSAASTPSGSNSSWTANSGYGGWLPVAENSPCPNKYQDNQGQWWCAAPSGGQVSSQSGICDPTAPNYLQCVSGGDSGNGSGQNSSACTSNECIAAESGSDAIGELIAGFEQDTQDELEKFKKVLDDDLGNFQQDGLPFKDNLNQLRPLLMPFLPVSTSCSPPSFKFKQTIYELDCKYFDLFKNALGWFLSVCVIWNIWGLAIKPIDR